MADVNQKVTKAIVVVPASALGEAGTNHQKIERFSLFDAEGNPIPFEGLVVQTSETVVLDEYAIAVAPAALADDDTINEALGKLEFRVDALENP